LLPKAPSNLTALVSDVQRPIHLTWTDNSDNETGFEIDRQMNNWGWNPNGWDNTFANITSADEGSWGWNLDATYSFRVRAVNQTRC
jgi:hypothetical protein